MNHNFRRHFKQTQSSTLDESLVRFRGRCPFKMYMPSKPGNYGLLIRTVAESNLRYMWKMWPYSGRPADRARTGTTGHLLRMDAGNDEMHGPGGGRHRPQRHDGPVSHLGAAGGGPAGPATGCGRHHQPAPKLKGIFLLPQGTKLGVISKKQT